MSGWGPPPGGAGQGGQPGGWGSPPPGGGQGGQGGWGGSPPPPPPGPQDPYGQQPYGPGPSGPQNPYGGQPPQDPYGQQPYQPSGPQQQQPGWGQPQQPQQPGWGQPDPYGQQADPYGQQPPAYGPPDAYGYGAPQPPKKKTGLILGLAGGGVGLVVLIVVAIVVISSLSGGADTKVITPDSAGGLSRDRSAESQSPEIGNQKDKLKGIAGGKIKEVLTAIYSDGSSTSSSGLSGKVFFLGATAEETIDQEGFMNGFKRGVGSQMTVKDVDPGPKGGQAACATSSVSSVSTSVCIWVDDSTFGEIVPSGKSQEEAAELMLKMRNDIEVDA